MLKSRNRRRFFPESDDTIYPGTDNTNCKEKLCQHIDGGALEPNGHFCVVPEMKIKGHPPTPPYFFSMIAVQVLYG